MGRAAADGAGSQRQVGNGNKNTMLSFADENSLGRQREESITEKVGNQVYAFFFTTMLILYAVFRGQNTWLYPTEFH